MRKITLKCAGTSEQQFSIYKCSNVYSVSQTGLGWIGLHSKLREFSRFSVVSVCIQKLYLIYLDVGCWIRIAKFIYSYRWTSCKSLNSTIKDKCLMQNEHFDFTVNLNYMSPHYSTGCQHINMDTECWMLTDWEKAEKLFTRSQQIIFHLRWEKDFQWTMCLVGSKIFIHAMKKIKQCQRAPLCSLLYLKFKMLNCVNAQTTA